MSIYTLECNAEEANVNTFPLLTPGEYKLQVMDFKEKTSLKDQPIINIQFAVIEGESKGTWVFHNMTLIPKGQKGHGFVVRDLKALDQPHDGTVQINPDNFIGKQVIATVNVEEYKGKKRNVVENMASTNDEIPF